MGYCAKHFWASGADEQCPQCAADARKLNGLPCDRHPGQKLPCASCAEGNMRRKPTAPAVREFRLTTVVGDPSVELCNLLSQIMSSYSTIDAVERNAVVCWFRARYRVL